MSAVFIKLLNMSITASVVALALLLLKLIFKKLPRFVSVILWSFVAIRLILPISIDSALSLIPSGETVPEGITSSSIPQINSNIPFVDSAIDSILIGNFSHADTESVSELQRIFDIAGYAWLVGFLLMLSYFVLSHLRLASRLRESIPLENEKGVYLCDNIPSPFIFGLFRVRIYIPFSIDRADIECVIAHERAHIARRDYVWKPLAFLLLSVYWFNPILWIANICFARDIEIATDERVIKEKGETIKLQYSKALLNCSGDRRFITACPTAFGENAVKGRIRGVLNYKKPTFWVIALSVIIIAAVPIFFLTNPTPEAEASYPYGANGEGVCDATVIDIANGELTVCRIGFVPSRDSGDGLFKVPITQVEGDLSKITVGRRVRIIYGGASVDGKIPTLSQVASVHLYDEELPNASPISDFKYRNNYYGGKTITEYIGKDKNVVVPSVIDGKPVSEILGSAFSGNDFIESVYLPDTLYKINPSSFKLCLKLKSVRLPSGLYSIGSEAFYLCKGLTKIDLPSTLVKIDGKAFSGCTALKDIILPESLTSLGQEAFADCQSLEYIEIPKNITDWGYFAFKNCGLTELVVHKDLKKLGVCAFYNCYKLESVTVSESTEIGQNCFAECYRVPKELREK